MIYRAGDPDLLWITGAGEILHASLPEHHGPFAMDLDATPFRYFLTVAEERSFTRAAQLLHVSQPALSAQIREFERRLGFALFQRTSRRVELTAEGRLFLGNARRMVAEASWANQAAREIRDNELRIGRVSGSPGPCARCKAGDQ